MRKGFEMFSFISRRSCWERGPGNLAVRIAARGPGKPLLCPETSAERQGLMLGVLLARKSCQSLENGVAAASRFFSKPLQTHLFYYC